MPDCQQRRAARDVLPREVVWHFSRWDHKAHADIKGKNGTALYDGAHEIVDAESFGRAFADVWARMHDRQLQKSTSIGVLMEALNEGVLEDLEGAEIGLQKLC
jgi:hypothetical protein